MLTKNQIKEIKQLHQKKYRVEQRQFLVEGVKMVKELQATSLKIRAVYCVKQLLPDFSDSIVATDEQMNQMSSLTTPPGVLAVVDFPELPPLNCKFGWTLVLNDINDPGNLGTIIRTADWFGIKQVVCSENCVDIYNPKVVQSSMGAIFRVPVYYTNVVQVITDCQSKNIASFAADMNGIALNDVAFPDSGLLVLGSESHGISDSIKGLVNYSITIPGKGKTESLNVSVAAGIICSRLPIA